MAKIRFYFQYDEMDCGPACIRMIASYYNIFPSAAEIKNNSYILKTGVSLIGLQEAAKYIGLNSIALFLSVKDLITNKKELPALLHWHQNHFVVLKKITKNKLTQKYYFHIADPEYGFIKLSQVDFEQAWISSENYGTAMFFELADDFKSKTNQNIKEKKISIKNLLSYLFPFKKQIVLMFVMLFLGSLLTLILPFLTQNLIDKGISAKNINIIVIILLAQLAVYLGTLIFEIIRNWLMLVIGTKISIKIISDFLKKILSLPIKFFDSKMIGDFNQRITDNERIEQFLTSQSLLTLFSFITFSIFFFVLLYYDVKILLVYLLFTALSLLWSSFWLKKLKFYDYFRFKYRSENQESIYEIFDGVTEMKLNQFEDYKRREWKNIQQKLFKLNIKLLRIDQLQLSGFDFFNQTKNIFVTFIVAIFVVENKMTMGELLSVSYIIGQMNSPVNQLVSFFRSLQEAKLSLNRINEINSYPQENTTNTIDVDMKCRKMDIKLENVSFQYEGPKSPYALQNINLLIPHGKTTAIVGASGSGKTTLIKLLLKFYNPTDGKIFFADNNILNISSLNLYKNCGVVMQDGYIFSDTIKRNIVTADENIDEEKLRYAIQVANLEDFINSLPLKLNTKIGKSGNGISGGEKQRITIARAIYKNPQFIFFDEATSSLDAKNEKIIYENLQSFYKGKTVIVVAHRLSTVMNADQIVVLNKGKIAEIGTHAELTERRGAYFELVRNQLELGN
ncbi:MAG: peptidase domain-containing ABC transporter [Firmicutes bacterium]|nr:peptidase domain-containing ABC transporter [Bacillota bacterium]